MKKVFTAIFLLAAVSMFAAPQVTVIGKIKHSFSSNGLEVNAFHFKSELTAEQTAALIKSIQQSKLVVLAETQQVNEIVFSNSQIKNALTEFFKNGGTFYLWVPSWSWMNKPSKRMYGYFNYYKIYLPLGYKGFGKGKTVEAAVSKSAPEWVTSPGADFKFITAGANNRPLRGEWQILAAAPDGSAVVLMHEKVHGNGRVIVSYVPMLFDKKAAPFIDNLVKYAYGDLLKK